ncbi:helix-turn-helix domain-containing protein [Streptomyces sp. NPDC002668]|uniref:helix-turn-helix domain-containing protein n=1 Tax=Streptomyces sp. NPDC002668 TaxID=3154422 RepID=UPI003317F656
MRARMIELSWQGVRVPAIGAELGCSQKTVRCWLHRFNRSGLEGLEDLGGQGRNRRITETERSRIIGLVKHPPPGRLTVQTGGDLAAADEAGPPEWTLDALAAEARRLGIEIGRSQVRRIPRHRSTRPPHAQRRPSRPFRPAGRPGYGHLQGDCHGLALPSQLRTWTSRTSTMEGVWRTSVNSPASPRAAPAIQRSMWR